MREAVAVQDECCALRAALEQWRSPPRSSPAAAAAVPAAGAALAEVHAAAGRALDRVVPRVERLGREQESLKAKFSAHGLSFDLGGELQRVRHAAVAVAAALLRAAALPAAPAEAFGAAECVSARRSAVAAAERRAAEAEAQQEAALRLAYRVHQFAGGFDAETERLWLQLAARLQSLARARAAEAPPDHAARARAQEDRPEGAARAAEA